MRSSLNIPVISIIQVLHSDNYFSRQVRRSWASVQTMFDRFFEFGT